jgi:cytoskeletal protein RodZ
MARFNGWRLTRAGFIFIVVAILLGIAVFASVRFVQQRGEQVRQDEATEIARQNQQQAEAPVIARESTPSEDAPADEESATTGPSTPSTAPEALPQTGAEGILPIIAIAAMTYGTTLVVRERRRLATNPIQG